jgi:chromosome partitioning protein
VRLIKQAQSVRQKSPKALMFLSRAVKGTKLKTEALELLGKLTPTIKPCSNQSFTKNKRSSILWNKQLRYGMQGGQPASYSGKEDSRLFKEIMGALT